MVGTGRFSIIMEHMNSRLQKNHRIRSGRIPFTSLLSAILFGQLAFAAPAIHGVDPLHGSPAGGTAVTIKGNGFISGTTVSFDGLPAAGVTVVDESTVTVVTPPHAKGIVDISVANNDGSGSSQNSYLYAEEVPVGREWVDRSPPVSIDLGEYAFSRDGATIYLASTYQAGPQIWKSADFGENWSHLTTLGGSSQVTDICCSSEGIKVYLLLDAGGIVSSDDGGATWTERAGVNLDADQLVCSADGSRLAFRPWSRISNQRIWLSQDSGETWLESSTPVAYWSHLYMSPEGGRLIASSAVNGPINDEPGHLWVSNDFGATWSVLTSAGARIWNVGFISSNGQVLAAGAVDWGGGSNYEGNFYFSTDSGVTWSETATQTIDDFPYLASTPDGSFMACMPAAHFIRSDNHGLDWEIEGEPDPVFIRNFGLKISDSGRRMISRSAGAYSGPMEDVTRILTSEPKFPPVIESISPAHGETQGGATVAISGTGFTAPVLVSFGGILATNVTVVDATTITCVTPPHAQGKVDVAVATTAGGDVETNGHTYGLPTIEGVSPACGPVVGGTLVTMRGKYFTGATAVHFGGEPGLDLEVISDNMLRVTTPSHARGWVTVEVVHAVGNGGLVEAFNYHSPPGSWEWIERTSSPQRLWSSIASSADGQKLAAVNLSSESLSGHVWLSSDAGKTWRFRGPGADWLRIASSADGNTLVATTGVDGPYDTPGAGIYISNDSGETWTNRNPAASNKWFSVSCSDDGLKMAAIGQTSPYTAFSVWLSGDGGTSWAQTGLSAANYWKDVEISGDGAKLIVVSNLDNNGVDDGSIWTSDDFGATWIERTSAGEHQWSTVAVSQDGMRMAAAHTGAISDAGGKVFTSADGGVSWQVAANSHLAEWLELDSGSTGETLIGLWGGKSFPFGRSVYTTPDHGESWEYQLDDATFAMEGAPYFSSVTTSSAGTRLAATEANAHIWTTEQVIPPSIAGVVPGQGPLAGGTPVTITGTGFLDDAKVLIGGRYASDVVVVNDSTLTALAPASPLAGRVDVEVATRHGCASLSEGYTYGASWLAVEHPEAVPLEASAVLGFGDVYVGDTTEKTITLRNIGISPLTGLSLSLAGGEGDFVHGVIGNTVLPPGGSTTVSIGFQPSTSGSRAGQASIQSDQNLSFPLELEGTGLPVLADVAVYEVTESGEQELTAGQSFHFGGVAAGSSVVKTIRIKNVGATPLNQLFLQKDGAHPDGFTIGDLLETALPPGGQATFSIGFNPQGHGSHTASFSIFSNDPDESPWQMSLAGDGTSGIPLLSVFRGPDTFGPQQPNQSLYPFAATITGNQTTQIFTIRNDNGIELSGLQLSLSGADPEKFSISTASPDSIPAGSSGSFAITFQPTEIRGYSSLLKISAGGASLTYQIGISGEGVAEPPVTADIYAWGAGFLGQLGDGARTNRLSAVEVVKTGALLGKSITGISGGEFHTVAKSSDGRVYAWGANFSGQLGDGSLLTSDVPVATTMSGALAGKTVSAVAAGGGRSCALTSEGRVYAWGFGGGGELGNGGFSNSSTPVEIDMEGVLSGKVITALAAGANHTAVLANDGAVYCWGVNGFGQIGHGSAFFFQPTPAAVDMSGVLSGKSISAIAAGANHTLVLSADGEMFSWGNGTNGALGNGASTDSNIPVAVDTSGVLSGKIITSISCGADHSVALASDGTLFAWGANDHGQLGIGTTVMCNTPVAVNMSGALAGKSVVSIQAGGYHTLALTSDGMIFAWGMNSLGALGVGSDVDQPQPGPVDVTGVMAGKSISAIAAGHSHSFALEAAPTVDPGNPFDEWRQLHFPGSTATTGPGADHASPQGDGISNLMKFALGMDPTEAGVLPVIFNSGMEVLSYTYTPSVAAVAAGVVFEVEFSPSLDSGSWDGTNVNQGNIGSGGDPVTATIPKPELGAGFLRLKVSIP